jgi:hypothetical protein
VNVTLNGLPKSWELFVKGLCAWENIPDWQRLWDDCIQEETWEEPKQGNKGDEEEEDPTLVSNTRKGKGKGSKGNNEESTSKTSKKDLSKIKCFVCHKYGHYASQCLKKKGKGKTQTVASTETQLDDFATKFEKELSMFSYLSTITNSRSAWYLDYGASHHMTGTHEFFTSWLETDSDRHVELGTHAKCGVEGVGTFEFQLESGGFLKVADVLYVTELKKKFVLGSVLEDMGFSITFY